MINSLYLNMIDVYTLNTTSLRYMLHKYHIFFNCYIYKSFIWIIDWI